jgi:hypothetical protein
MSDLHHTGRRSVLAGIGAAALTASFNPPLVRPIKPDACRGSK